jgi:hypothetical protein
MLVSKNLQPIKHLKVRPSRLGRGQHNVARTNALLSVSHFCGKICLSLMVPGRFGGLWARSAALCIRQGAVLMTLILLEQHPFAL